MAHLLDGISVAEVGHDSKNDVKDTPLPFT